MKRLLSVFLCLLAINLAFAGGLVTNTNQSAAWARMLVRDASTQIDAVYFNPAGLTKLSDGFHLSLSNQSIFQDRTLTNSFPYLNDPEFNGSVSAPFFPNFYAAYKTGKFAFSFGFTPIGGGGSAVFDAGVPMIEVPVSSLVPNLGSAGVTGYSVVSNFEGSSVYFGLQAGISYAINDMISVYAGARYVWAKNTYQGNVSDISVITANGTIRADDFMNGLSAQASAGATSLYGAADGVASFAGVFGAATTFDQAYAAAAGNATAQAQIQGLEAGLTGLTGSDAGGMPLSTGEATYNAYGDGYSAQAAQLSAGASLMGDQSADVTQTGNGWTPIVGLNLALMEDKLNIGLKYEFQTNMTLTNETAPGGGFVMDIDENGDPVEMFPDGAETNADIPAQLTIGVNYKFNDKLSTQIGYHTYFDKNTGWENVETEIDQNYWELGLGLEYNITDKFLVSGGYLRAVPGVNESYQSDLSYSLTSNTFGLGGAYKLNDKLTLQLGGYYTMYLSETIENSYTLGDGVTTVPYTTTYEKSNFAFAIGLDIAFGGK